MASIPYVFECSKDGGFVADPNAHASLGYVVSLGGLGLHSTFAQDLTVAVSHYTTTKPPNYTGLTLKPTTPTTMDVVGVIEKFEWDGSVGGALEIDFYVSQSNATQLKALQQSVLQTTKVSSFSWWICGFDPESKQWYEQAYPKTGLIAGVIQNKNNPELNIDLSGVSAKDGVDVLVYKVSMAVVPATNQSYALHFATRASIPVIKSWGLVLGTLSAQRPT